ncbi:hypothetical protein GCM10023188_14900 [Pontibacter saemangeumensis]|uniref:Uncharacterized protein n=1 Tax=Pontibacter saemangeumensis TaxID=1084525 RepID=A0ABP8LIH7_9BACT
MKRLVQTTALLFVMAFAATGCAGQRTAGASTMLQDEEKKEQIFSAILNDREMRAELMKRMMAEGDGSGMMMQHMMQAAEGDTATCRIMGSMMMENPHMMDMMMGSMMDKAESDDAVCRKMCLMMMDSDKMKGMMQQMQGQPSGGSKANGGSNMKTHLDGKHTENSKDR